MAVRRHGRLDGLPYFNKETSLKRSQKPQTEPPGNFVSHPALTPMLVPSGQRLDRRNSAALHCSGFAAPYANRCGRGMPA